MLLCLLNLHILFFFKIDIRGNCYFTDIAYTEFWNKIWYWIDMLTYTGIPFVILASCNGTIIYKVIQSRTKRLKVQNPEGKLTSKSTHFTSMTYMLTTVSVTFLLLTLPPQVFFVVISYIDESKADANLAFAVTQLIRFTNHSINFLLYCISGKQFRREVYKMFKEILN